LRLFATFSTGGAGTDQSANSVWTSSDPTIVAINASGVVTGITNGSVAVTGAFGGFTATTNINVHTPVFVDLFTNNVDYVANGLVGSTFDGVYLNFGDVPFGNVGTVVDNVAGQTFILNENIHTTNALFVQEAGGTWRFNGDDGPFLYKVVTGDFEISAHVIDNDTLANNFSGLMARLYVQRDSHELGKPSARDRNRAADHRQRHHNHHGVGGGPLVLDATGQLDQLLLL